MYIYVAPVIITVHFPKSILGGNAMVEDDDLFDKVSVIPEKELYIRWFQLVTFLQSMQISISPWQYDNETTEIGRAWNMCCGLSNNQCVT